MFRVAILTLALFSIVPMPATADEAIQPLEKAKTETQYAEYGKDSPGAQIEGSPALVGAINSIPAAILKPPTSDERANEQKHLWYDRRVAEGTERLSDETNNLARYTLALAIFTAVMIAVGLAQLIMFYRQWRAMRDGLEHSQKATEAAVMAQRPWVKLVADIHGILENPGNGPRLPFKIMLENIGNSPATNVNVWVALACSGGAVRYFDAEDKIPQVPQGSGFTLFPKDPTTIDRHGGISTAELDRALADTRATGWVHIGAVVSVTYEFVGGKGRTLQKFAIDGTFLGMIDIRKLPVHTSRLKGRRLEGEDVAE